MAAKRRVNWISQQRVDVPDMRSVESAVSNDFDELIASFVTGPSNGYVLRGFKILMAGAIGGSASGLQLEVDPGAVFHVRSGQSGTFYLVPSGSPTQQLNSATNPIVDGAFAPSAINYVSLEYERFIDDTTSSQIYLWNPTTNNETVKNAPRASILRYRIKITSSLPASNYLPIAIVTTDSGNNVTRIDDARQLLFSQATGGFSPNPFNQYTYPNGRTPNPNYSSSNSLDPFSGGDKDMGTLKDKLDAITTEIQLIKGTPYWTSQGTSGSLDSIRTDLGNTVITGRGNISHDAEETTPGLINWSDDIFIRIIGSRLAYKLLANPTSSDIVLSDNQVAYVNLIRGVVIVPNLVFTNGSDIVSSVGSVAWTTPLQAGDWVKIGSETDIAYYQIDTVDSLSQVTLTEAFAGTSTGPSGAKSKYAFGSYQTSATPSSDRDIYIADREDVPPGENIFWLFARSDNGGATARVYIRFLGMELQDGETEEIADGVSLQLLEYIGSPLETASRPLYDSALNPGSTPLIEDLTFGSEAQIAQNDYFNINSAGNHRKFYVWFNIDGFGVDPNIPFRTPIVVNLTSGMTNAQVATEVANALNAEGYQDFIAAPRSNPNQHIVRVTRTSAGSTAASTDGNIGAPFAVTQIQAGSGTGNWFVKDGDNLTLAIKELDTAIGSILETLDTPSYRESQVVIAGIPADSNEVQGPLLSGSTFTLPNNNLLGGNPQYYTVGKGKLEVYLNGQYLPQNMGSDITDGWDEVGLDGAISNEITISQDIVVGDIIEFRLSGGAGGPAGPAGATGPQGPQGPQGDPGQDSLGGPVNISTKTANYTILNTDKIIKADCTSGMIIFTLPSAASAAGRVFWVKKIDITSNILRIQAFGSELIDDLNYQDIIVYNEGFMVASDGTTWSIH
jgi:hypothetical protein